MVGTLADPAGTALRARADSLEGASLVYHYCLDIYISVVQLLGLVLILGLPVRNSAAEKLLENH